MACNFTVHHFCGNICRQRLWKHSCMSSHCTDSAHAYYPQLSAGEPRRCWLDCSSALHTVWSCYQTDIPSLAPRSCYVQVTLAHYDVSDHVFINYTCSHQLWQVIKTFIHHTYFPLWFHRPPAPLGNKFFKVKSRRGKAIQFFNVIFYKNLVFLVDMFIYLYKLNLLTTLWLH